MTLRNRLAKLELTRPNPGADLLQLDLPRDLYARIDAAKLAGTYPQSLSDGDMLAIVAAADKIRGRA
jgi:hypothetical protein